MRFLQQPTINLYGGKNLFEKLLETLRRLELLHHLSKITRKP